MDFSHFVSSYYPDTTYGGDRLYSDMVEQEITADRLGYRSITIPEHPLINLLLVPSPLQMAVKLAGVTEKVDLITSVAVLPLRDMRIFAGEVAQADILTEGRLILGVGRGAFAYEIERMGVPMDETKARFDESLDVLIALLTKEEVGWKGDFYDFEPLTVMPRPITQPPRIMIAVMNPAGIAACTKRGFNIQTTPLSGHPDLLRQQVAAHKEAKEGTGERGAHLRIMLSRLAWCAKDQADAREKLELAYEYYSRFDNVFTGPGIVQNGAIAPLPRSQTIEELGESLLIATPDEMVDRLKEYDLLEIDEVIFNNNLGAPQAETIECMERFAAEVKPHFES
jgi:alkanesulfonate monooxygenase SsuD/methylene tetrahydromethanopterin reductase-like flavin-dependent oxidoreductase (luciferase family)